jgi:hypothetical protein
LARLGPLRARPDFAALQADFLAALASPRHVSRARVIQVIGRR